VIVVELTFPAGRFHATPWGRHVNEGVPEWPPSPYRLLRALYDSWKRKNANLDPSHVAAALAALAGPPRFRLPRASASHTRSFLSTNDRDPSKKQLIFDAFVVVDPRESLWIGWPDANPGSVQEQVLDAMLRSLQYLGRSESWVSARIARGVNAVEWNCTPFPGPSSERVRVACARLPRSEETIDMGGPVDLFDS
jgi:CRISPR-associated protein Csb2